MNLRTLVFTALVTGLAGATLIETDCPVCKGRGAVPSISHAGDLRVVAAQFIDTYVGCPYEMSYIVGVSVSNAASNASKAFLLIRVIDRSGALQGEGIQEVQVDAKTTKTITVYVKAFEVRTIRDPPDVTASVWSPESTMVPCVRCQGRGKVSLIKWLMLL